MTLEGVVRDVVGGGDAVVETKDGVVFAPFALPGERVRLVDVRREGRAMRGRVAEVLEASPDRVEPACPHAERCGGCPLMPMGPSAQRAIERRLVQSAVDRGRAAGEPVSVELVPSPDTVGYRRRARLAWRREGARTIVGYRARRSHRIAEIDRCVVLVPALEGALASVRSDLAPALAGEGELLLALGDGGRATVVLEAEGAQPAEAYTAAKTFAARDDVAGVALRAGPGTALATWGDPREVATAVDDLPLRGTAGGFSQANAAINRRLAARVVELAAAEGARVLELYAGHGNLTVGLARGARELVAVEQDAAAARACRENLDARGLTATVRTEDAAAAAKGGPVDVVVLDPPRTGARDALDAIAARRPERIVYVSCDPATLGRDLARLGELGYGVDAASAFEMFPHTGHVEAVVRLVPVRET